MYKKILLTLYRKGEPGFSKACTFLGIAEQINFKLDSRADYFKLHLHLLELEKQELIEERHYPSSKEGGAVDYALENKGIELMNTILE